MWSIRISTENPQKSRPWDFGFLWERRPAAIRALIAAGLARVRIDGDQRFRPDAAHPNEVARSPDNPVGCAQANALGENRS
jgi:hypothetical protein